MVVKQSASIRLENVPYGYPTSSGYMGRLADGTMQLFSDEGDYREFIFEEENE